MFMAFKSALKTLRRILEWAGHAMRSALGCKGMNMGSMLCFTGYSPVEST
jgi:hypothetical protein